MEIILIILLIISLGISIFIYNKNKTLRKNYRKVLSQKKSSEVVLGQVSEQLAPFLKDFKHDPKKLKFLGQPIDYIYFGEDKLIFIEVKSGNSRLSKKQNNIKSLINNKKIYWEVFRIK